MFFYASEHFHQPSVYATIAYLIVYGYLKDKIPVLFWTVFIMDVLLTYHKDTIIKQIDLWRGKSRTKLEKKVKERPEVKEEQPELRTTKSGYFDTDFLTESRSSLVDQMIKDSKSM